MKRLAVVLLILVIAGAAGLYLFNRYWVHRFDALIARQAGVYRLDPDLVWSVIHEETYFRPWMKGEAGEIGLMQVTPTVGREWAAETGMRDLAEQMRANPDQFLLDPETNIKIGCWYMEKIGKDYRGTPGAEARIVAGYNAGPSRAAEWNRVAPGQKPLTEAQFVERIDFPTTRAYVSNILERWRGRKKDPGR